MKIVFGIFLSLSFQLLHAAEFIAPIGSIPCEADWGNRSRFELITSIDMLDFFERSAARGDLAAQLRLGLARKTLDGKWTAPADNSYNLKWLQRAKNQGSKTAEWIIAKLRRREITHEALLIATIEAAEKEGNPWAASDLFSLTSGRLGADFKPTSCPTEWTVDGKCATESTLKISTARKWAEISAEGGNSYAQEWLCTAAINGAPERGQPKDDKDAKKWCEISAKNACSKSNEDLIKLFKNADIDDSDKIRKFSNQPWRNSSFFFTPNQQ